MEGEGREKLRPPQGRGAWLRLGPPGLLHPPPAFKGLSLAVIALTPLSFWDALLLSTSCPGAGTWAAVGGPLEGELWKWHLSLQTAHVYWGTMGKLKGSSNWQIPQHIIFA